MLPTWQHEWSKALSILFCLLPRNSGHNCWPSASRTSDRQGPMRILVVEDDFLIGAEIESDLSEAGAAREHVQLFPVDGPRYWRARPGTDHISGHSARGFVI